MPSTSSDSARLRVLRRTVLLDTPAEQAFDRLTSLASRLLRAPVSLVSLVDEDRQFFKSCIGLPEPWASQRETPLSHSFCQHVVENRSPLIIDDARTHPLVADNLAIRDLGVVAYAGIPLVVDGEALGSFCVIDSVPRDWSDDEVSTLTALAGSVMSEIELRMTTAEATRAVKDRDEMLAVISHDLRNPAGVTVSASQLLRQPWLDGEQRTRQIDAIERAGRRMLSLIDNLMMVSQLQSGEYDERAEATDLAAVASSATADVRLTRSETGVELRDVGLEAPIMVKADENRLRRVFDNLLDNALKFTPRGGTVSVTAQCTACEVCIRVRDSGVGISADLLPKLFARFGAGASRYGSTGLGLFISQGILVGLGGTLTTEVSAPGEGATFEIRLPLLQP